MELMVWPRPEEERTDLSWDTDMLALALQTGQGLREIEEAF